MEEIYDHRHIEPANITSVTHIHTLRPIDPEQNSTYHRKTPHQGTGWLSTWNVMYKLTVDSDSTHRRWLPGRKDNELLLWTCLQRTTQ